MSFTNILNSPYNLIKTNILYFYDCHTLTNERTGFHFFSGIGLNLDIPPDHLPKVGLSPGPYKKNLVKFKSEIRILRKFVTLVLG